MSVARAGAPDGEKTRLELAWDEVDRRGWGSTCSWLMAKQMAKKRHHPVTAPLPWFHLSSYGRH
jgi:hypothetical protein